MQEGCPYLYSTPGYQKSRNYKPFLWGKNTPHSRANETSHPFIFLGGFADLPVIAHSGAWANVKQRFAWYSRRTASETMQRWFGRAACLLHLALNQGFTDATRGAVQACVHSGQGSRHGRFAWLCGPAGVPHNFRNRIARNAASSPKNDARQGMQTKELRLVGFRDQTRPSQDASRGLGIWKVASLEAFCR